MFANYFNQHVLRASASPREYSYDADGNLLTNGVFSFSYDADNRLSSVSSNGVAVAAFAYDAKSRRVRKATPTDTHTYFYDDWNLVEERVARTDGTASSNGTTRVCEYFWGPDLSGTEQGAGGVGGLLAAIHDGVPYFPCYDHNDNTAAA